MITTKIIAFEEGFRRKPYHCSEGYPTIGHGFKIGPKDADLGLYEFTLSEEVSAFWLQTRINELYQDMMEDDELMHAMLRCNSVRAAILVSMAFQMGLTGLKGFKKMLNHIESGDWQEAAYEGLNSRWARQTSDRAERHMDTLEDGELCVEYCNL